MTEITDNSDARPPRGTIFYDGACRLCTAGANRWRNMLAKCGFQLIPLQTPGAAERLRVPPQNLLDEVRLLTRDGRVRGGADAIVQVAGHVWWGMPIYAISRVPGAMRLLRFAYRSFVPYRYCVAGRCGERSPLMRLADAVISAIPLLVLPMIALVLGTRLPPWALMWLMAGAIFIGFKWLTWRLAPADLRGNRPRSAAYLLAWPGMDARAFLDPASSPTAPARREWGMALAKLLVGAALVWLVARFAFGHFPLLAGWIGMIGLILLLHFGLFHLIALLWRSRGIDAEPIMDRVLRARSPGDFWSRRWNRGFSDLMRRLIVRPMGRFIGIPAAVLAVFLVSGLLHELVITLPARGGWGGPTAYFILQSLAILLERSSAGATLRINRSIGGRIFTAIATLAPLPLLFPAVFVERVMLPFLAAMGAFASSPPALSLSLAGAIVLAGVLHFGILLASAPVPQVLNWRTELSRLSPLSRHIVWTHGAFIVLTIAGFGAISILAARELAADTLLARLLCGFIAIFWLIRLSLQFILFDARPYLRRRPLKLGYHALTIVFSILTLIYAVAAVGPRGAG